MLSGVLHPMDGVAAIQRIHADPSGGTGCIDHLAIADVDAAVLGVHADIPRLRIVLPVRHQPTNPEQSNDSVPVAPYT